MKTKLKKPVRINKTDHTSLIAQRVVLLGELKAQVMDILGWDEQKYCNFQFESGMDFIAAYTGQIKAFSQQISYSPIFWNWWRNTWATMDVDFNMKLAQINVMFDAEYYYIQWHNGKALATDRHPHSRIIYHTYNDMMVEFIDAEFQKDE